MATIDTQGADFLLGRLTPGMPAYNRKLTEQNTQSAVLPSQQMAQQPAATVSTQVPQSTVFGNALLGMLKQYQSLGTRPYVEQQFNASQNQINASNQALTNPAMQGYSPSTIMNAGNAATQPYEPAISGAQKSAQTYGEQINSFKDVLTTARQFQQDILSQEEKVQADAQNIVNLALTKGGSAGLEALIKSSPNILKKAGMDANTIASLIPSIKAQEAKANVGTVTQADKDAAEIRRIDNTLNSSKAGGQFVDGNVYLQERRTSSLGSKDFDARFSGLLSPSDQAKYGIGTATSTPVQEIARANSQSNVQSITDLLNDSNLDSAVGPNALARFSFTNKLTGGKSNFIAGIEQIRSQLNLDTLIQSKAQGATFGALSDNELRVLASAATRLGTWAIKDKAGNIKGYKTSESAFRKELDKINNFAKLDYVLKGGNPADVGVQQMPDGTYWSQNSDGTYTQIK